MIIESIIIGGAVLAGGTTLATMIYTVKEKQEALIESFGKYKTTIKSSGLKLKAPWHKVRRAPTDARIVSEHLVTKTSDDIFVTIPINMRVQVLDTHKFTYATNDPEAGLKIDIAAAVKQMASNMEFASLFKEREEISRQVLEKVGKHVEDLYGVSLLDVVVDEPKASEELQRSYNNRKASENEAVVKLNNAQAEKQAAILRAEGRKEELRLDGEGVAEQRSAIFKNYAEQFNALAANGLTTEMAQQTILLAMANDTVRDAAKNGNTIITTTNTTEMMSQIQALADKLNKPRAPLAANDRTATPGAAEQPPKHGM